MFSSKCWKKNVCIGFVIMVSITFILLTLYFWERNTNKVQEGSENKTPILNPTLLDLVKNYKGGDRLIQYITYMHNNTESKLFSNFLKYLINKSTADVQNLLKKICDHISVENTLFSSIKIDTTLPTEIYRCEGGENFENYILFLQKRNNKLLNFMLNHSHEQIRTLLVHICDNSQPPYEEIQDSFIVNASSIISTDSIALIAPSPSPSPTPAPAPAPVPVPETSAPVLTATTNITGYVMGTNIEGCGDVVALEKMLKGQLKKNGKVIRVSDEDVLGIDSSIQMYYTLASSFSANDEDGRKFKENIDVSLSSFCKKSNENWNNTAPASFQGWILSIPTLASRLDTACTPLLLQDSIDKYSDGSHTKVELYKYMNNLSTPTDKVTEKVNFLNWICSILQMGAKQNDMNKIFTWFIKKKSTTFTNPFLSSSPSNEQLPDITESLKQQIVSTPRIVSLAATAETHKQEANSPSAKVELETIMKTPKTGTFDSWLEKNPTYALFTGNEGCKQIITPYMDTNPDNKFVSRIYHYLVEDLKDSPGQQVNFFTKLCKKYSKAGGTIPTPDFRNINKDISSCYFGNKTSIDRYYTKFSKYSNSYDETYYDIADKWCKANPDLKSNDEYFDLNIFSKLNPSTLSTPNSDLVEKKNDKFYLKNGGVQVAINNYGNIIMADGSEYVAPAPPPAIDSINANDKPQKPPNSKNIIFQKTLKYYFLGFIWIRLPQYDNTVSFYPTRPGFMTFTAAMPIKNDIYPKYDGPNFKLLQSVALPNLISTHDQYNSFPYYVIFAKDGNNVCQLIQSLTYESFTDIWLNNNILGSGPSKYMTQPTFDNPEDRANNIEITLWVLEDLLPYIWPKKYTKKLQK